MSHIRDHCQSKELEVISGIIDATPIICDHILQDLNGGKSEARRSDAKGMSAELVLRCIIVKILFGFTYEKLAFHIVDSQSLRWFCRFGMADDGFKKTALNRNIKVISDQTRKMINRDILGCAKKQGGDWVRVLTRLIERTQDEFGFKVAGFANHTRRAERRLLALMNAKDEKQRKVEYIDFLKTTGKVLGYAHAAAETIKNSAAAPGAFALFAEIKHYAALAEKVIAQAHRRSVPGQRAAAADKVVSIFEPHTDVEVRDRRHPIFGHNLCRTGGAFNLTLDCLIAEGNPADADLAIPMLDRQEEIYGRSPLKVCFDGGFTSKDNLKQAKAAPRNIKDVCLVKRRGLEETDMCRSEYVYHRLRLFTAWIESGITWLKRSMGLTRCMWKGWHALKSYVWSSIVEAKLLTIARAKLAPTLKCCLGHFLLSNTAKVCPKNFENAKIYVTGQFVVKTSSD